MVSAGAGAGQPRIRQETRAVMREKPCLQRELMQPAGELGGAVEMDVLLRLPEIVGVSLELQRCASAHRHRQVEHRLTNSSVHSRSRSRTSTKRISGTGSSAPMLYGRLVRRSVCGRRWYLACCAVPARQSFAPIRKCRRQRIRMGAFPNAHGVRSHTHPSVQ